MGEPRLHAVHICDLCLNDLGGECHVPGCAFWMSDAPTGDVLLALRRGVHIDGSGGSVWGPPCESDDQLRQWQNEQAAQ